VNILIAEDDPVSRQVLRHALDALGHEVTEAADGRAGWEAFQKSPAEVVITDWMMPEMDGPTLCRRIREVKTRHYVYVVFLTIVNGKTRYLEAMDAGADEFLNKPLDREQLKARLCVAERIRSLHREIGALRGALRVCPGCKSYCDDHDGWQPIENLLEPTLHATVQTRICPDCEGRLARAGAD
jgi:CheY-like chemotaxis protein